MNERIPIDENELVPVAMQIILNAGDARLEAGKALDKVELGEFEAANEYILNAREYIRQAHSAQTDVIQNEAKGISYQPCLLFIHAQDTLMTIISEVSFAERLVHLFKVFDDKINAIKTEGK